MKSEPNGSGCKVVGWVSPGAEWNRLLNSCLNHEQNGKIKDVRWEYEWMREKNYTNPETVLNPI